MKPFLKDLFFIASCIISASISASAQTGHTVQNNIDLSGTWRFEIDSLDKGMEQHWYSRKLTDAVKLPGSMTTNGKGFDVDVNTPWTGSIMDSTW